MEELNDLTKRLFAEGYTLHNHPDNVIQGDWQNLVYKWDYLKQTIWESPCGICLKAWNYIMSGDTAYDGITYCAENNNELVQCPPIKRAGCKHFNKTLLGCVWHVSDKPYDYENSLEKLDKEYDQRQNKAWVEVTNGAYCQCLGEYDDISGKYTPKYELKNCLHCTNAVCVIRKQQRDLTKVNVFYDVRRTWKHRIGLVINERIEMEKGVKVFGNPVAKTDAEIWMKMYNANLKKFHNKEPLAEIHPKNRDYSFVYFSNMHHTYGDMEDFEFFYEPINFRVEWRESRDLEQDLSDISEGIEVIHASDLVKQKATAKRESKVKRKEAKVKANKKKIISKFKKQLEDGYYFDDETGEKKLIDGGYKAFLVDYLRKHDTNAQQEKTEQLSLF